MVPALLILSAVILIFTLVYMVRGYSLGMVKIRRKGVVYVFILDGVSKHDLKEHLSHPLTWPNIVAAYWLHYTGTPTEQEFIPNRQAFYTVTEAGVYFLNFNFSQDE